MNTNLINADCLDAMRDIPDGSVDLTVTSPPYDNLRTYNGNNDQWGEHVWRAVIADLYRATSNGGVVVWIVGDATIKGSETGTSFKQALWAIECGFNLHDTMIYKKTNPVPNQNNRYQQNFEFMFVFSKGKPKCFNVIRVASKGITGGSSQRQRDGSVRKFDSGGMMHPTKYRTAIWDYSIGGNRSGHPAVFPIKLAQDHIMSWSNEGQTILDPFMGSGTTGVACKNLGRSFIGIEMDADYFAAASARIDATPWQTEA